MLHLNKQFFTNMDHKLNTEQIQLFSLL